MERAPDVATIRIFSRGGRSQEAMQSLCASIARKLDGVGIAGADILAGYVEDTAGDWSFGFGQARYVAGECGVPGR